MRKKIIEKLKEIEVKENIRILFAIESGSRAWGFPSKDSDYDVRFVYIHPREWYLSIKDKKDVLEYAIDDLLDINGWDIRKALKLFRKMNPTLLEWIISPIVYVKHTSIKNQLIDLQKEYYSPKSCIYHYLHMAKGNYREYLKGDNVRVKKYFYVLRPILACKWIENTNTMAPMEFERLLETQIDDKDLYNEINVLLKRKKQGAELDIEPKIDIINKYLEEQIRYFDDYVIKLRKAKEIDISILDNLFIGTLEEVWKNGKLQGFV